MRSQTDHLEHAIEPLEELRGRLLATVRRLEEQAPVQLDDGGVLTTTDTEIKRANELRAIDQLIAILQKASQ